MQKNIQTHNAKLDLVERFCDYANIADVSYALLHYIDDTINYKDKSKKDERGDEQKLNAIYTDKNTNIDYISTYARAIEARFNQDKVGNWCIITTKCFANKDNSFSYQSSS